MTHTIVTDGTRIPDPVTMFEYWVLWDFEVKQPRAPWKTGHCYTAEWRQDGDINPRTHFEQARAAADLGPVSLHDHYPFPDDPPERIGPTLLLPHEGEDTPGPGVADPPFLFIDYDNVLDKTDGTVPTEVWDIAKSIGGPLFVSRSYFDPEKDVAGSHQLARGTLPGSATTVDAELEDRGHIEIYYRSRMTGFTWEHVRGTPTDTLPNATEAVADVVDRYGSPATKRRASVDATDSTPTEWQPTGTPPEELDGDTTTEIDDVFRAIRDIGAGDIRLRSTLTEDMGTRKSYNPSWEPSDSGTRLGYDSLRGGDSWIYRRGDHPVDALQVVAREEGLIMDVTDYPDGETFWKAVQALRDRGATIPYYEGDDGTHPDVLRLYADAGDTDDQRRQVLRALRASKRQ